MIEVILEVIIIGLLTMLAGIILMVVNDIFNNGHSANDNR
jgi:hypothetical protein